MKVFVSAVLVSLLLITTFSIPVSAVAPGTPDISFVNKLNAAVNVLDEVQNRLNAVLSTPPEPDYPPDPGVVGRLNAMSNQLGALYSRVPVVLGARDAPATRAALQQVLAGANAIMDTANAALRSTNDPAETTALQGVSDAASSIVDWANQQLTRG